MAGMLGILYTLQGQEGAKMFGTGKIQDEFGEDKLCLFSLFLSIACTKLKKKKSFWHSI